MIAPRAALPFALASVSHLLKIDRYLLELGKSYAVGSCLCNAMQCPFSRGNGIAADARQGAQRVLRDVRDPKRRGLQSDMSDGDFDRRVELIDGVLTLFWSVEESEASTDGYALRLRVIHQRDTWFAFGFNSQASMVGSDVIAARQSAAEDDQVLQFSITARSASGVQEDSSQELLDTALSQRANGDWVMDALRPAVTANGGAIDIDVNGSSIVVFASGPSGDQSISRRHQDRDLLEINWQTGDTAETSGDTLELVHGILMTLAWGILIPMGITIGRFAKDREPTTGPRAFWFMGHRIIQGTGLTITVVGFIVAIVMVDAPHFVRAHHIVGLIVMILGVVQVLGGNLRPALDSTWRGTWSMLHKGSGYVDATLAAVNLFLGLSVIGASNVFYILMGILWFVWAAVFAFLALTKGFPSTYMARHKEKSGTGGGRSAGTGGGDVEMSAENPQRSRAPSAPEE